ncbi:phage tail protein [Geminicoccus harenae]|uniref:phage tail protein n=1 Tax=Geminicoccus harenae TaxID=2498453 RepID=UPI00168A7A4D|nr:phage tail protein [Geminicoccus harenae]
MPRNGAGGYEPPSNSWNPAVELTDIDPADFNELLQDLIQAISQSLAADGQTPATARIAFALGIALSAGSTGNTAIQRTGYPDTGITFPDEDGMALVAGAVEMLRAVPYGLLIGAGNTAQRPSAGSGRAARTIRYNSDLERLEGGENGTWSVLGAPTGTMCAFAGTSPPDGWLWCSGAAVSRSTYARLFNAITVTHAAAQRVSGSPNVGGLTSTGFMQPGMPLSGPGIPSGATVSSVLSGTSIQMSANATSSGTGTLVTAPWGVGDGSSTFNLPDLRGFSSVGRTDMTASTGRSIFAGTASVLNGQRPGATGLGMAVTNFIIRT